MSIFQYPVKSWFVGQRPFSVSEVAVSPQHKIDLLSHILIFRCPRATCFSEHAQWFQPSFVDTYTKGSVAKPESTHGTKQLMTTSWQFRPSIRSEADAVRLDMLLNLECQSQQEEAQNLNLFDKDTLVAWVKTSYQEQLAKASMVSMFMGTDGTMALEFNDKDEVKNRIADEVSLDNIVKTGETNNRPFVFFQVGNSVHYYCAMTEKDALCFQFSLKNLEGHPLDLEQGVDSERLQKINEFIIAMLETIELTASSRLKEFLASKNIQTR